MIKYIIMKKTLHIYKVLSLFLILSFNTNAQDVDLIASVDEMPPFTVGQTFNYNIMSTGSPYFGIRIKLIYDPSVIQLNSLTPVYNFDFTPVNDTSTPGLIKFEAAELGNPVNSDITIFTVEFQILDNTQTISIAHNYDSADGTVVVNNSGNDILGSANDIIIETLSSNDFDSLNSTSLYPNPTDSFVAIRTPSGTEIKSSEIYTVEGKYIEDQDFTNAGNGLFKLDLSNLPKSMYFLVIKDQNNNSKTFRVIVN